MQITAIIWELVEITATNKRPGKFQKKHGPKGQVLKNCMVTIKGGSASTMIQNGGGFDAGPIYANARIVELTPFYMTVVADYWETTYKNGKPHKTITEPVRISCTF